MRSKRGEATLNIVCDLRTKDNKNFCIKSLRSGAKYSALIIRAKFNGSFVDPKVLNGKRVFYILSKNNDIWNNKRHYLYLYANSTKTSTENLKTLNIAKFSEKSTYMGGTCKHFLPENIEILLDEDLCSREAGTHWDRQLVFLTDKEVEIYKHYVSNRGNGNHTKIVI